MCPFISAVPYLSFCCCCFCLLEAAPAAFSLQVFLQGHLNLSISLAWAGWGLLVCTILGLEEWCGEGEGAACSVDLVSERLGQGGSAAATSDSCVVSRCSCYQKLSHFKSSVSAKCSYLSQPTAGGVPVNLLVFVLCFCRAETTGYLS